VVVVCVCVCVCVCVYVCVRVSAFEGGRALCVPAPARRLQSARRDARAKYLLFLRGVGES